MALILSGLVHGVMFLYQFSDTGGSDVGQAASVTVQLELVSQVKKSVNENIAETKSVEKVVASESAAELRDTSELSDGQSNMDAYLEQFTVEADILSDYTDRHVADQNQVVGDRANELSQFVYEAINQHKRYPYLARKQRREGRVKLNFVMHPDGKVTDVAIVQSSDFTVLDNAAKQAVEAISPFALAAEYLTVQHLYNVDIDFRLN